MHTNNINLPSLRVFCPGLVFTGGRQFSCGNPATIWLTDFWNSSLLCQYAGGIRKWLGKLCLVFLAAQVCMPLVVVAEEVYSFAISEADASSGLNQFAQQTRTPVLFLNEDVRNRRTNSVAGSYTFNKALGLLLDGTGIRGVMNQSNVLTISVIGADENTKGEQMNKKTGLLGNLTAVVVSILTAGQVNTIQAQGSEAVTLDEIVVTAQRREQNLQDVPISMNVFVGEALSRQGFEKLAELSLYSPGLVVRDRGEEQGMFLRGAGTQGKNRSIEQAVPTFVDGIHFGQAASVKNHFLDIERIEVLKGPQPVFFGQNAAAGALNITTRKPGPEWEGTLDAEFGSFGSQELVAAFGGPITDTFGIRVAGRWDRMEGFLRDYITGKKFPEQETKVGRVIMQWTPNEKFEMTGTFMASNDDIGARPVPLVRDGYPAGNEGSREGEHLYLEGLSDVMDVPPLADVLEVGEWTNLGTAAVAPFLSPSLFPDSLLNSANNQARGVLDLTQCTDLSAEGVAFSEQFESCDFSSDGGAKPWYGILDMNYILGDGAGGFLDGAELNSKTAFVHSTWWGVLNNGGGPIIGNPRYKDEDLSQWSSELRLTSATGGTVEWMTGLYYQNNDLDTDSDSFRADGASSIRGSKAYVTSEWTSGFVALTFNFPQYDNKFSLDLGARYTHVKKEGGGFNTPAEWIVAHPVTGEPTRIPFGRNIRNTILDRAVIIGRSPVLHRQSQFSPGASFSPIRVARQELRTEKETNIDPQIVLHYRPNDNNSLYARYATGYKAGSFDTGVTEVTHQVEDFYVGPENYRSYEIGAKGNYLDGRIRTDVALYNMKVTDLQITNINTILDRSLTQNAGAMRSRGLDFGMDVAVTESLKASINGSIMDAKFLVYDNAVCTADEISLGLCDDSGLIDRSGSTAANAPDWKIAASLDYEFPVLFDRYRSNLNVALMASDEYIDNRNLQRTVMFLAHEDMGASFQITDLEETWSVIFWARNLMNVRPSLRSEFDLAGSGLVSNSDGAQLATENFNSFGVSLKYNFFK